MDFNFFGCFLISCYVSRSHVFRTHNSFIECSPFGTSLGLGLPNFVSSKVEKYENRHEMGRRSIFLRSDRWFLNVSTTPDTFQRSELRNWPTFEKCIFFIIFVCFFLNREAFFCTYGGLFLYLWRPLFFMKRTCAKNNNCREVLWRAYAVSKLSRGRFWVLSARVHWIGARSATVAVGWARFSGGEPLPP